MGKVKYKSIFLLLMIYIVISSLCCYYIPNIYSFFIQPIDLIFFAILSNYSIGSSRGKNSKELIQNMVIVMLSYFIIYELLGIILGFVRNPYSLAPLSIIKNIWTIIIPIICIEYIRDLLINSNSKSRVGAVIAVLVFFLIEINLYTLSTNMIDREKTFIFLCSVVMPNLAFQFVYSYLAVKGSYKLVLTERLLYQAIILFTPILPNLNWFSSGLIGIIFPTIIYLIFKFYYDKRARYAKRSRVKKSNPIYYVPLLIFIFFISGFVLGLFKYKPLAVASNSMNVLFYRGDVAIYRKIDEETLHNLKIDDIIIFRMDNKVVIHRIIEVIEQDGKLYFRTKGDNNNSPDAQTTKENDVIGKYEFHIKYIGYPSVWLSEFFKNGK